MQIGYGQMPRQTTESEVPKEPLNSIDAPRSSLRAEVAYG